MNRAMKKPLGLSARRMMAAITRLNKLLPLFLGGSDLSKFSDTDLIELAEWSMPEEWRTNFDSDRYFPTQHNKKRFIKACEAIEHHAKEKNSNPKSTLKWELEKTKTQKKNTTKDDHS